MIAKYLEIYSIERLVNFFFFFPKKEVRTDDAKIFRDYSIERLVNSVYRSFAS